MYIAIIQIIIEIILTITLLICLTFGIYAVIKVKEIEKINRKITHTEKKLATISKETENDINKLKIKSEIIKSSLLKTIQEAQNTPNDKSP